MNKQTIINRYFANCESLRAAFCSLPADVQNSVLNATFADNKQTYVTVKTVMQDACKHFLNTQYSDCNVYASMSEYYWDRFRIILYSYGSHFPIIIFDVLKNTYYLNHTRYSRSTSKHQAAAFNSLPAGANVLYCDFENAKFYGGCWSLPSDPNLHFTSYDALLAYREKTEKARRFESAAEKYFRTFSDDFNNVINPAICNNANSGDFSQAKKLLKKWINQKRFVKYGIFERATRYKYFINTLETAFLWDWFVKEANKSIRKYADSLPNA